VAGCCEHGNEPSGFIKDREFLDQLSDCWLASQEGIRSMELVKLALSPEAKLRIIFGPKKGEVIGN
jgi:hypothetical protein